MKKIKVIKNKILADGKEVILFGGEFQYFRIDRDMWENSLKLLKEAKFNFVGFYIPWIWHEYEEGKFDFSGKTSPERDLEHLLKLCQKLELNVIVRPGPYIYAEYQGLGVPIWLREKYPEILMVNENGQVGNEISVRNEIFLQSVKNWFEEFHKIVKPYIDNKLIFAWQIDNETGLPEYGNFPSVADWNKDTIKRYQEYLSDKFENLEEVNKLLETNYENFSDFEPPKKGKGNKVYIRSWSDFVEDYLVDYLKCLKKIILEIEDRLFLYLNDPYLCQWPNQSSKKTKVATVGFDNYTKITTDKIATHDIPFSTIYAPELYKNMNEDSILIGAEVGGGWFDPRVNVKPEATMQLSMASIIKGMNLLAYYIIHDGREEDGTPWLFQAAIDQNGKTTPRYNAIKKVGKFINEYNDLITKSDEVYSPIGIATYLPNVWDMLKTNISLKDGIASINKAIIHFNTPAGILGLLTECGYNSKVFDLEQLTDEKLQKLKVLFIFSVGFMKKEVFNRLKKFVSNGGTLITIGYPVFEDELGNKFEDNELFPAQSTVNDGNNIINFGNNNIISKLLVDIMNYQVTRNRIKHKHSLETMDMMQPFTESIKYISKMGTWVDSHIGEKIWVTRFISTWKSSKVTPLIKHNNQTVGYSTRYGHGKSIFCGTILAGFYDSPAYYTKHINKKSSLIHFMTNIIKESGVKPIHNSIQNLQIIKKRVDDSLLLSLINRGPARDFSIEMDFEFNDLPEIIFKTKNSRINKEYFSKHNVLKGWIDEDDFVCIHITEEDL